MVSANYFHKYNILKKYNFILLISNFKWHHSTMQTKHVVYLAKSKPGSLSFLFHLSPIDLYNSKSLIPLTPKEILSITFLSFSSRIKIKRVQ